MRKNRKKNKVLMLLVLLMAVTLGYALLSTTLKINGTAGIKKNTWSIHWDPTSYQQSLGGNATANTPAYSNENTNITYGVNLELPGDYYEFTIDAVNDGTIAGAIDEIEHTVSYTIGGQEYDTLPEYILYTMEYADQPGVAPAKGDILSPGAKQKYKIRIEYDPEATTVSTDSIDIVIIDEDPYVPTKEEQEEKDPDYGGLATNDDATPGMWFYEINDDGDHTASIVALKHDYTPALKEVFDYSYTMEHEEESNEYNYYENHGTQWHDKHWNEWEGYWCGEWDGPEHAPDILANVVLPKQVKLNSQGIYDPNGEMYTVTRFTQYIDTKTDEKYKYINRNGGVNIYDMNFTIETMIIPDTYLDVGLGDGFYRLASIRNSRNLTELPIYATCWSDEKDPRIDGYVPRAITSVPTYDTNTGPKSELCTWGSKVKTAYIPSTVTSLGGANTLYHDPVEDNRNYCYAPENIVVETNAVRDLVIASGYAGNVSVDPSKFN